MESSAGSRFLAAVKDGRGLKRSARAAGVGKETGYRWLRESFLLLRDQGLSVQEVQVELGYFSPLFERWHQQYPHRSERRHHLRIDAQVEQDFWSWFGTGLSVEAVRRRVGVSRSTAHRLRRTRYVKLRDEGVSVRIAASQLRVPLERGRQWEIKHRRVRERARAAQETARRRAVCDSARHAEELIRARSARSDCQQRDTHYWELMRSGLTNTEACRILGVNRRTGARIRARHHQQTASSSPASVPAGRYLTLRERLQIADLLRLDCSLRAIATELGRSPSTVKRELDRHRDLNGRYLPHSADHAAAQQRRRPKAHKLIANPSLRRLVQRKLNRCWSPDEVSGWLRRTYPADLSMRLCPETIYRALLVPGGKGLHKRYCRKLRTGRRIRRSRWLTRSGHGAVVREMTMITQRPAEVETKQEAGHWEGDLILGIGCRSAMMTLRERKTQYGIVVNLPRDHTAETVNAAATSAFASLPQHLKRSLTWDQGVEMARHRDLTTATGIKIYFAERCSPWQRGANENYNGLLRQYFPKGTDLSVHSPARVKAVMKELNNRPRKGLNYETPTARLRAESRRINRAEQPTDTLSTTGKTTQRCIDH